MLHVTGVDGALPKLHATSSVADTDTDTDTDLLIDMFELYVHIYAHAKITRGALLLLAYSFVRMISCGCNQLISEIIRIHDYLQMNTIVKGNCLG